MRADEVLLALSRRHSRDLFVTEVKTGPTVGVPAGVLLRIDAIAMARSWTAPTVTAYEVKVDRHDFVADSKWTGYLEFCHRFYFATPKGLVHPDEVPDPAGLVWAYPGTRWSRIVKQAQHRPIEPPVSLLYYLLIARIDNDRHPFFSSQRQMLEAWVQDRAERLELAQAVRSKLVTELRRWRERAEWAEHQLDLMRRYERAFDQLRDLLKAAIGVDVGWVGPDGLLPSVLERIRDALRTGASGRLSILIRQAMAALAEAERMLRRQEDLANEANTHATPSILEDGV